MIHQYRLNGYNIVLDVCSGAVHLVDELAYDMIALFERCSYPEILAAMLEKYRDEPAVSEAEIARCYEEIKVLKDSGQLFTLDTYAVIIKYFDNSSRCAGRKIKIAFRYLADIHGMKSVNVLFGGYI